MPVVAVLGFVLVGGLVALALGLTFARWFGWLDD